MFASMIFVSDGLREKRWHGRPAILRYQAASQNYRQRKPLCRPTQAEIQKEKAAERIRNEKWKYRFNYSAISCSYIAFQLLFEVCVHSCKAALFLPAHACSVDGEREDAEI